MKGTIITYEVNDSYNITKLTNLIIGRVVKVKRKDKYYHYYYEGGFSDEQFIKLGRACYFFAFQLDNECNNNIRSRLCDLDVPKESLITPREHFRNKYADIEVINL